VSDNHTDPEVVAHHMQALPNRQRMTLGRVLAQELERRTGWGFYQDVVQTYDRE